MTLSDSHLRTREGGCFLGWVRSITGKSHFLTVIDGTKSELPQQEIWRHTGPAEHHNLLRPKVPNTIQLYSAGWDHTKTSDHTHTHTLYQQHQPQIPWYYKEKQWLPNNICIPSVDHREDPLKWLKCHKINFPWLCKLAQRYLCIQATSSQWG